MAKNNFKRRGRDSYGKILNFFFCAISSFGCLGSSDESWRDYNLISALAKKYVEEKIIAEQNLGTFSGIMIDSIQSLDLVDFSTDRRSPVFGNTLLT